MLSTFLPLLAAAAIVNAAPYAKRGLAQIKSNCNHDFSYSFDDGPYIYHNEILDDFDAVGGKTSFFMNGDNWSCIYDAANVAAIRRTYEEGHLIASHTWSHASLDQLSHSQIDYEIQRLDEAFVKILGIKPKFLRPPYGAINEDAASYIQNTYGKTIVLWDSDSGDSTGGSAQQSYNFYNAFANAGPGQPHMALSHETQDAAINALRMGTVTRLNQAGIHLQTVAQCLDVDSPYEFVGGYGTRDSSWYCGGNWTPTPPGGGTSTTSAPPPTGTCSSTYISQPGDTCASIETKYHVAAGTVLARNTFLNCNDIWSGTPICIPPGGYTTTTSSSSTSSTPAPSCVQTYNSLAGDTCASVESKFGLSAGKILAANTYLNCNDIWAGTPLCIPPGGTGPTTSSTTTTPPPTPTCASRYKSVAGDTCASIETKFGLASGKILAANTYLNCNDIWANTDLCIPPGGTPPPTTTTTTSSAPPSNPSCVQTYFSVAGDTCTSIETKFGLTGGKILAANSFLNCNDIWSGTPICVPPGGGGGSTCTQTISSTAGATCDSIGLQYGVSGAQIKAWNDFLNCNDIWANTPVCVKH